MVDFNASERATAPSVLMQFSPRLLMETQKEPIKHCDHELLYYYYVIMLILWSSLATGAHAYMATADIISTGEVP